MKKLCAGLERSFDKVERLLVLIRSDWAACGQISSQIAQKYGYEQIGRARLTNDALSAMSAVPTGLIIFTKNAAGLGGRRVPSLQLERRIQHGGRK